MATMTTRSAPRPTSCKPTRVPRPAVTIAPRPASISRTPMTTRSPRTTTPTSRLLGGRDGSGVGLDDDRRSVRNDLGHRSRELAAVEAHRDHRVGAHQRGVLHQPIEGLPTRVLEELGVFVDLAAAERPEPGDQVAGEAAAPDDQP